MRIKNSLFLLLLFLGISSGDFIFAQGFLPTTQHYLNFSAHYGFIIPHHYNMQYLIKGHVPAGELDLIVQTNGQKKWEHIYKLPEKGIGIFVADLGNPEQLGKAIGIFPFINFPLNPGRKFKLYLRSSDGIGMITRPFDRIKNHKNNVNSSYINAFINLRLNSVFYIGKKIRMETGLGLTHLSNGSFAKPNLGINIATIHCGVNFIKGRGPTDPFADWASQDTLKEKYSLIVTAAAGVNETAPPDGKKYPAYMLGVSGWKKVSEKSKFGAGLEGFYELSNMEDAKRDSSFDTSVPLNNLQVGLKAGYELVIGRVTLPYEMGYYLYTKTTRNGNFYHRIGVRFFATKHIVFNYTLRTHWFTAENLELGIGYRF